MRAFALITLPPESWRRGRHGLGRSDRRELHDQRLGRGGQNFLRTPFGSTPGTAMTPSSAAAGPSQIPRPHAQ